MFFYHDAFVTAVDAFLLAGAGQTLLDKGWIVINVGGNKVLFAAEQSYAQQQKTNAHDNGYSDDFFHGRMVRI